MLQWASKTDSTRPIKGAQRIYIPMGYGGFLLSPLLETSLELCSPSKLATSGLAVCVGLVIYNEQTHSGMLAHFDSRNCSLNSIPRDPSDGPIQPADLIILEMFNVFLHEELGCSTVLLSQLQVFICHAETRERSTIDIAKSLQDVADSYHVPCQHVETKGIPDIYIDLVNGKIGEYQEKFRRISEIVTMPDADPFDIHSNIRSQLNFPSSENFLFYRLTAPMIQDPNLKYMKKYPMLLRDRTQKPGPEP